MDLDEVRRKLTAGYERINNMKNSTERMESCRANLRRKQESMLREIKSLMNYTAAKLHQLQLHMEDRVREIVAEREIHLDGKKKEIHDGYANLVQVCVEADRVLRGRHDDLLGRSCRRLLSNFEISKCKLDAAERIDVNAILGFELWNNIEMFLTSNYLAKIHFSDRTFKAEEFWVESPQRQTVDIPPLRENKGIPKVSNHGDFSNNCRLLPYEKSAEKSLVELPRQPLETIEELPEDSNTHIEQKIKTQGQLTRPAVELVHVREVDLSASFSKEPEKPEITQKISSQRIPPPPGFSKLAIIPDVTVKQDTYTNMNSANRHKMQGISVQSLNRSQVTSECISPAGDGKKPWRADGLWDASGSVSSPETSSTSADQHTSSFSSNSSRALKSPPQTSMKSKEEDIKAEMLGRDGDDFVWDSDDSAEIPDAHAVSGKPDVEVTQSKLISIPQSLLSKKQTTEVPQSRPLGITGTDEDVPKAAIEENSANIDEPPKVSSLRNVTVSKIIEHSSPCKDQHTEKKEQEQTKSPLVTNTAVKKNASSEDTAAKLNCTKKDQKDCTKKDQKEEAALSKVNEVPRLMKSRSRRLDLSLMLENNGDQISAKCIEKIRGDFNHPIGVCTNSKGEVIVADTGNHVIKVCNNGRVIHKFGAKLGMRRPSAVVVNEKDEIFVKDDQCVYHFDADGQHIKTIGKRMMNAPYGLGMTRDGKLVVVDDSVYTNARIHIFEQWGAIDTYPYQPLRYRCDESKCRFLAVYGEEVLTSDLGLGCLYLTNLRGVLLNTFGGRGKRLGELNQPAGIAVDSVGNWIVADSKNHRVQVFHRDGQFMALLHFSGESVQRPSGIHLTTDGLLYVINYVESVIGVFKLRAL